MEIMIKNAVGNGNGLLIDEKNRAHVDSVIHTSSQDAASDGKLYQFGTGVQTLTSANESALLFIENNEETDLEIANFTFYSDAMQGGSVDAGAMFLLRLYTKTTGITPSSDAPIVNNNLGSSRPLQANVLVGAEGSAVVGAATQSGQILLPQSDTKRFPLYWIIPRGTTFAITVQPAAGNTSVRCGFFFDAYVE